MGDRAQIHLVDNGVWLYTHSKGYKITETAANGLDRGRSRWDDPEYLARILFSEMIKDDIEGTTGYGIGTTRYVDAHTIIHVSLEDEAVAVESNDNRSDDAAIDAFDLDDAGDPEGILERLDGMDYPAVKYTLSAFVDKYAAE